jgi:arginyl-tRNA synthetase
VTRFVMLTRKNDAPLDFDFDKVPSSQRTTRSSTCNTPMPASLGAAQGGRVPGLRFLDPGRPDAQAAKIALARATGVVIANGLAILGVTPVEEMR